jgi:ubiquitin-protein ligase
LRRIKKEYENAVKMGICYDWTKQRLIKPKTKHPSQNTSTGQEHHKLICLGPLASNLRHWHFSFRGCGIYDAGIYHGRILLPKDYPSTPPHVQLWTPSGRFIPFHDICLSASSYHPESWSPRWSVLSLVQALRLHMLTNPQEIGGKSSSLEQTTEYSKLSLAWRLDFHAGKRIISVDHALIIRQGALSIIDDDDSPSLSESTKEEIEDPLADSSPQKPELEESFQSEASIEQAVAFKPKIKRKKRSKKANKGGSSAVAFKQKEQIRRSSKLTLLHSVILALVKVLASPLRFGLFSFVLLYFLII